jgi:GNAT superfamily N-acetyltransferase
VAAIIVSRAVLGKAEGRAEDWHGHVSAVTVAPQYRRLGLARRLMAELERVSEHMWVAGYLRGFCAALAGRYGAIAGKVDLQRLRAVEQTDTARLLLCLIGSGTIRCCCRIAMARGGRISTCCRGCLGVDQIFAWGRVPRPPDPSTPLVSAFLLSQITLLLLPLSFTLSCPPLLPCSYKGYFVDLFVRASNTTAITMYQKLGYTVFRCVWGEGERLPASDC